MTLFISRRTYCSYNGSAIGAQAYKSTISPKFGGAASVDHIVITLTWHFFFFFFNISSFYNYCDVELPATLNMWFIRHNEVEVPKAKVKLDKSNYFFHSALNFTIVSVFIDTRVFCTRIDTVYYTRLFCINNRLHDFFFREMYSVRIFMLWNVHYRRIRFEMLCLVSFYERIFTFEPFH